MEYSKQTMDWALDKVIKAEERGDMVAATRYQEIAMDCVEPECSEIPSGGTGFFVKAERRGEMIIC